MYENSKNFFVYDNIVYEEFMKDALNYRTRYYLVIKKQCVFRVTFKNGEVKTYYPSQGITLGKDILSYNDAPNYERSFFHKLNASGINSCITDALTKIEKV